MRARDPQDFVGHYGQDWRAGVLSEHTEDFVLAGGTLRGSASGSGAHWAVLASGEAHPLVCSEIIVVHTEDGDVPGRCGVVATKDGACAHHAEQLESWRTMSEPETIAWERALEHVDR